MSIFNEFLLTNPIYPNLSIKCEEKSKNLANLDENSYIRLFEYKLNTFRKVKIRFWEIALLHK